MPEVIKAAFAKTGVCPFNPDAVHLPVINPSLETSIAADAVPLAQLQSTPVRVISRLLQLASKPKDNLLGSPSRRFQLPRIDEDESENETSPPDVIENELLNQLKKSSVGFLLSDKPLTSDNQLHFPAIPPLPSLTDKLKALKLNDIEPTSEQSYQYQICEMERMLAHQAEVIAALKSREVLRNVFTQKLQK